MRPSIRDLAGFGVLVARTWAHRGWRPWSSANAGDQKGSCSGCRSRDGDRDEQRRVRSSLRFASSGACCRGQFALLDRENLAGLDLKIFYKARAPFDVGKLRIIDTGLHPRNAQPLVVLDGAILVVLALIGPELVAAS